MSVYFIRFLVMGKNTCHCRGAPSRPHTTAADGKTGSGPGTDTGSENRAGNGTGRERGKGRERGIEDGRERESVTGHQTNQWTHILRYFLTSVFKVDVFEEPSVIITLHYKTKSTS